MKCDITISDFDISLFKSKSNYYFCNKNIFFIKSYDNRLICKWLPWIFPLNIYGNWEKPCIVSWEFKAFSIKYQGI